MFERKQASSESWYCPNGHTVVFTQSKLDKAKAEADALRKERDRLKQNEEYYSQRQAELKAELKATNASLAATKGVLTKTSKRIGQGVCPCCNRSFPNLARHMAGKHKDFKLEVVG
jgi:chromosome segregation ATPase